MKKIFILLLIVAATVTTIQAEELLRFTQMSFEGWTYTRDDAELSTQLISQNRVYLYHDGSNDYTLVSPAFNCDSPVLSVEVQGKSTTFGEEGYNATKGSPTVELLDNEWNVIGSVFYKFETAELDRNFTVSFSLNGLPRTNLRVRLACWNADLNCPLSVRKVFVNSSDIVLGDVNGDGVCNATDVTALYLFILNNDSSAVVNGDQNGDDVINASDVTAVYNIILNASN